MGDLLAAASLLATVVTILYSLWYPELMKTLDIEPKRFYHDNIAARREVAVKLFGKALPLGVLAVAVAIVFLPDAWTICSDSLAGYRADWLAQLKRYDAIRTAIVLVVVMSLVLALYVWVISWRLFRLKARLGKPD
ncbi:hypothetical protein [Burkholderia sp. L27(2015)]|uniref:hypothetical protein n=1 Tax=Burkholderia sp. L27(2015) TaxID=1641858 RepID=UPI001C2090B4|nr:hypothetical protein [Burkholderia sp. L27(2015)]